jgi:hypothetical protein
MVKIVCKWKPEFVQTFENFDELGKTYSRLAYNCDSSVLGYVLGFFDLYVDGVPYEC